MKYLKKYEKYKKHYGSVGIVFWYNNKILLVHPYDPYNIFYGWSYPKGHYEKGETKKQTAIREVGEEINVKLPNNFLDNIEIHELKPVLKNKGIKHYWYFNYELSEEEFIKYFNNSLIIPKFDLQLEEVDNAKFINVKLAKKLISRKFINIFNK